MALTPTERKGLLMLAGRTQGAIAQALGVSTATVSLVVNDKARNERVEREIARTLGRPTMDVFPPRQVA